MNEEYERSAFDDEDAAHPSSRPNATLDCNPTTTDNQAFTPKRRLSDVAIDSPTTIDNTPQAAPPTAD